MSDKKEPQEEVRVSIDHPADLPTEDVPLVHGMYSSAHVVGLQNTKAQFIYERSQQHLKDIKMLLSKIPEEGQESAREWIIKYSPENVRTNLRDNEAKIWEMWKELENKKKPDDYSVEIGLIFALYHQLIGELNRALVQATGRYRKFVANQLARTPFKIFQEIDSKNRDSVKKEKTIPEDEKVQETVYAKLKPITPGSKYTLAVTIPKELRDELGIGHETELYAKKDSKGRLVYEKVRKETLKSLKRQS